MATYNRSVQCTQPPYTQDTHNAYISQLIPYFQIPITCSLQTDICCLTNYILMPNILPCHLYKHSEAKLGFPSPALAGTYGLLRPPVTQFA